LTSPTQTARILVVANRTASTQLLLDEVGRRAGEGASFTLLIPPEKGADHPLDWTPEVAEQLLTQAGCDGVQMLACGADALDTIHGAVTAGEYDEIIVSTVPEHLARWVHHDLPHRIEHLGMPVVVIPHEPDAPVDDALAEGLPTGWKYPPIPGPAGGGGAF
jgi:hypothetical protein